MLAIDLIAALQVTSDPLLDALTGALALATLIMAAATVFLGVTTRRSVREAARAATAAQAQADATIALLELEVQPVLLVRGAPEIAGTPTSTQVLLVLRNVGRGPAIATRVMHWATGEVFWSENRILIGAGEWYPADGSAHALTGHRGAGSVEPSLVSRERPNDLCAYCFDQFGNGLKFRLRTGEPPERWRRGGPRPEWAAALEEPFDYRTASEREARPLLGEGLGAN